MKVIMGKSDKVTRLDWICGDLTLMHMREMNGRNDAEVVRNPYGDHGIQR